MDQHKLNTCAVSIKMQCGKIMETILVAILNGIVPLLLHRTEVAQESSEISK